MYKKYIVALDQGTTSSRAIIFDKTGKIVSTSSKEFQQIYPKPGWVEHDPQVIWKTQQEVLVNAIEKSAIRKEEILCIGITNQRETIVLWDKNTGKPIYNAIVWQCRRTSEICEQLKLNGVENELRKKTGLLLDAYFSGTKIKWILDNIPEVRNEAERGNIYAGTIDTWLLWNLTKGKVHATDYSNASRTMLFNIKSLKWDEDLLKLFGVPIQILPEVKPSSYLYGYTDKSILGYEIPITSAIGDQQAALFGQTCFDVGAAKNTYGTGCFMLMNTGNEPVFSDNNLLTTIAWGLNEGVNYALEGSVFVAGAAIKWLRDELGIIKTARECDELAEKVNDTGGVYFVPAFVGLGTPYWDMYARGSIFGLTRGTKREHIARATLEAITYQVRDVIECMLKQASCELKYLKVDGGASVSDVMMQFQSDILHVNVYRPKIIETTAIGAAYLAGLKAGIWTDKREISNIWSADRVFTPKVPIKRSEELYSNWKKAVNRSLNWLKS